MKKFLLLIVVFLWCGISQAQISEEQKSKIKRAYIEACSDLNEQMPIILDEYTIITNVVFVNWELKTSYVINLDCSDLTEEEKKEFISEQRKDNLENAFRILGDKNYLSHDQAREFLKATGMKLRQTYRDINGVFIGSIVFDYRDF